MFENLAICHFKINIRSFQRKKKNNLNKSNKEKKFKNNKSVDERPLIQMRLILLISKLKFARRLHDCIIAPSFKIQKYSSS